MSGGCSDPTKSATKYVVVRSKLPVITRPAVDCGIPNGHVLVTQRDGHDAILAS